MSGATGKKKRSVNISEEEGFVEKVLMSLQSLSSYLYSHGGDRTASSTLQSKERLFRQRKTSLRHGLTRELYRKGWEPARRGTLRAAQCHSKTTNAE